MFRSVYPLATVPQARFPQVEEFPLFGLPKPCRLDEPVTVSLEDLVPRDH